MRKNDIIRFLEVEGGLVTVTLVSRMQPPSLTKNQFPVKWSNKVTVAGFSMYIAPFILKLYNRLRTGGRLLCCE